MKNFGLSDLTLVNAYRIPIEDMIRSMKGAEILMNCKMARTIDEATQDLEFTVGTSGIKSDSPKEVLRNYIEPREFVSLASRIKGKVGIILGREDIGLTNEELAKCDFFVHIPASDDYPILNVSSAAAILFYEMFGKADTKKRETITKRDYDRLTRKFRESLLESGYPTHRVAKTTLLFRRVVSRAILSPYEYRILMGAVGCRSRRKLA